MLLSSAEPHNIDTIDIHVVTCCLKEFLRLLPEPLVTAAFREELVQGLRQDRQFILPSVYQILSNLPQPNRDTLIYIIMHLQTVANSPACKMPVEDLAKIFGSILLGNRSDEICHEKMFQNMDYVTMVMECLIVIPETFWKNLLGDNHV